jgi:hypothetical protein
MALRVLARWLVRAEATEGESRPTPNARSAFVSIRLR